MKHIIALFLFSFVLISSIFAQKNAITYKDMMYDYSYNFYDVVEAAEAHFSTIDITKKGSGWKQFQRWKNEHEDKFAPSGDRSRYNPYAVRKAYKTFLRNSDQSSNESTTRNLFPNGWKDLGPYTVTNITEHYSAGLGRVEEVYIDPDNNDIIYIGSQGGGFWSSSNGGVNFSGGTTDFLPATGANAFGVSPFGSDTIYVNTQDNASQTSHGIYESFDGGLTWAESNFNPTTTGFGGFGTGFNIFKIAFHPTVPGLIYVGTDKGIFRSTDYFATWTRLLGNADIKQIAFHPTDPDIIYLYDSQSANANPNNILKSTDQGLSYATAGELTGNNGNRKLVITATSGCADCLYAASDDGIWKSIDEGVTFSKMTSVPGGAEVLAVSAIDTSIMISGNADAYASTDGGVTWVQKTYWSLGNTNGAGSGHQDSYDNSTNYIHADLRDLIFFNGAFYACTDGFLCKSTDNGETWTKYDDGIGIRENYKLGVSQSNLNRTICGSQDNGTSLQDGDEWVEIYGADGMEGIIHPLNDDWMIGSIQSGRRRLSKDGGQSTTGANPSGSPTGDWEAPLAYDPNDHFVIYNFLKEIHYSEDYGDNYTTLGLPDGYTGNIEAAAIAENNSDIVVFSRGGNIYKSTDAGDSFVSIKNNLPDWGIKDISFDPNDDNTIVVVNGYLYGTGEKAYITFDGGDTWDNITYNLEDIPIRCVMMDHTPEKNIYVGTEVGIFYKSMAATTWSLFGTNMPNVTVKELEHNWGANTIKAASYGRGLWENHIIGRENYPAIVHTTIDNPPTLALPKEGLLQYVTSKIHYTGTLTSVYVAWSTDTPIFDNTIEMSNISDSTWQTNQPLPDIDEGDKIYFKVYAVGSAADTSETYKFMYTQHPFEYCDAMGGGTNTYIQNVSILGGVLDNTSPSTNEYYTYYDSPLSYLEIGNTYDLQITNGNWYSGSDGAVWIDFNGDSDFTLDERVLYDSNTGNFSEGTFTVPEDAILSDTLRMRVRSAYSSSSLKACGTFDGEVEDYAIQITKCGIVNNTNDAGLGSLREAISCAASGDTIYFDNSLNGDTIIISSSELMIDKDLTILALPGKEITISSIIPQTMNVTSVFDIEADHSVVFDGFTIIGGYGLDGSAIYNAGQLTLRDILITNGDKTDINSLVENIGSGTITIEDKVDLE